MRLVAKDIREVNTNDYDLFSTTWRDIVVGLEVNGDLVVIADIDHLVDVGELEDVSSVDIHNMAVKKGLNGQGYGSKLIELLTARWSVYVYDVMGDASGFWEKMEKRFSIEIEKEL